MSEPEGGRGEPGGGRWVGVGVVALKVAVLVEDQVVPGHDLLAQDHGQELVVGDVLDHGDDNVTGLLEKGLVVPVGVNLGKLFGNQVVLPEKKRSILSF